MEITAESLGSERFKGDYGLRYAYLSGAMYKGIASRELVIAMAQHGMLGFFGTGGLDLADIESAIIGIEERVHGRGVFGMNLLCNLEQPEAEERTVDLLLKRNVRFVEAAAFLRITRSLVRFRLKGLRRKPNGEIERTHRLLAKLSRPEVARAFMDPPPEEMVRDLLNAGLITPSEAELAQFVPMADEVCVESDSGGHTDQGVALALMPAMLSLRDSQMRKYGYSHPIAVGAAGGIGTPHAAAAAFVMGADFVLTGSVNQCTVEAGTSDAVKDLLAEINVQDTTYAPAGDMFELGAKVQVARRGLFFPARANKLYELYQRHGSLDEIDAKTRQQIEEKYFRRTFDEVWSETRAYYARVNPAKLPELERNPKQKMALVFRWYFIHTNRLALRGQSEQRVDYQIHCGPALGAFNQWVKGTELESWRNRRVADIGHRMMMSTADLLNGRFASFRAQHKEERAA